MTGSSVLFDMDGLLLDTERVYLAVFNEIGAEYGIPDLTDTYCATIGLRTEESQAIIENGLDGRADYDTFFAAWEHGVNQNLKSRIPVVAGVPAFLEMLQQHGTRMVVATSTETTKAVDHLQRAGIFGFFEAVIGGDQVADGKPNPEIYHLAANQLGKHPNDCFIFEDSDMGILAAVRSKGRAVQIPDLVQPSVETVALGHIIAPSLLSGARSVGLIA